MRKSMHPIALPPLLATQFLDYILHHHRPPTTLIICSTRDTFLQDLSVSIIPSVASTETTEDSAPQNHHLLNPTIHLIAVSRTITLAFTPTLPHLRAYLAPYPPGPSISPPSSASLGTRPRPEKPILAIWGLPTLHRSTAEHSAQGLSRTLAVAVEAAQFAGQRLVLADALKVFDEQGREEGGGKLEPWREQVPLLSGSVRFEGEVNRLGGRTVEVGAVVGRWCRFVRVDGPEEGG